MERIELLVEKVGGQRELARRAGLKNVRHVGMILIRLRKNPSADIERETLAALARGGEVSVRWLATGDEEPDSTVDPAPRYANLEEAIQQLGPALVHEVAVDARKTRLHSPGDLDVSTWVAMLLDMQRNRGALMAAETTTRYEADEDDTPPAGRKR